MTPLVTAAIKLLLSGIKGGGGGGGGGGRGQKSDYEKQQDYHAKQMAAGGQFGDIMKNRKRPGMSPTAQRFLSQYGPNVG